MTYKKTGKKLLAYRNFPKNPIKWGLFLLEFIGRSSLQLIFWLLKFTFPASVFLLKLIIKLFSRLILQIKTEAHDLLAEIKFFFWSRKNYPKKRKRVKKLFTLPKITLPRIRLPKIHINVPKTAIATTCLLAVLIFGFYLYILKDLPSPNRLITRHQAISTQIYDRHGQLLYTVYNGDQNRTLVTLTEIPQNFKNATLAIEDKEFYHHQGFSLRGIARALERNLFNHSIEGGSTITQQLVKNALLSPEKTITRKAKELVLALEVELLFSKDEILQMYFNEIPYGGTAYGAQAAAKTYFNKNVQDLSLGEAAMLAGLPAAPTQYSPFGANPQNAFVRQKEVLARMVEDGYISNDQAQEALSEKITFAAQTTDIKAPHFVMYVKDLLVQKYGQRVVEEGGLQVITSLDLNTQEMVQEQVTAEIAKLENFHVTNGAALVTNPQTGEILAMVGSRDYFDSAKEGNVNVTTSLRQPGSSIKPINYAVALQNGYNPSTVIQDSPVVYQIPGSLPYAPVNYDSRFHGNVTLRTALGSSYNVPAVKVLANFGVNKMVDLGKKMGITTWNDSSRFGLSLTLGAGEVKMTDMAVVYGTLANYGNRVDLHPILKVTDPNGKIIDYLACNNPAILGVQAAELTSCNSEKILPTTVAYLLTDILADNAARAPAFGLNSLLVIPNNQVAVKTGTTNDKRDNWTIGYTQDYVVTVWVGNNDNTPMSAVASGVTGASPIWHNIFINLLADKTSYQFPQVDGLIKVEVCSVNGLLPCQGCTTKTEYFVPGTEPKVHCDPEAMKEKQEEEKKETTNPSD